MSEVGSASTAEQCPDADAARAPTPWLYAREPLAVAEYAAAVMRRRTLASAAAGDGHAVLVLPGFLAGPASTRFLRRFLRKQGYRSYDWQAGRNLGLREGMEDALEERLRVLHSRHGRVSVVGWSAGGIYARELARQHPDLVRQVITLGSPFRGNHQATHAWRLFRRLNPAVDGNELMSVTARQERAACLPVATTCIYSRLDGIVAWECCTSLPCPHTDNVEVRSTHLGYGHNVRVLEVIADQLARPLEQLPQPGARATCDHRADRAGAAGST